MVDGHWKIENDHISRTRPRTALLSFCHVNPHFPFLHARCQCRLANRGAELMLAGADVELPAMPWTCDHAAGDFAFSKRPALMRTNAIQGIEIAVDIEQRDNTIPSHGFKGAAGRAVSDGGDAEPGHGWVESGGWRVESGEYTADTATNCTRSTLHSSPFTLHLH